MSKNANSIRVGNIIILENKMWRVLKTMHTMPGKGGAFVQMELKDIKVGTKRNERFRSEEKVDTAHFEDRPFQYLFRNGAEITLMDNENYEQIEVDEELFGENHVFLQDGMTVKIEIAEDQLIAAKVPTMVTVKIAETEGVVKGQTAAGSNKPAILENGVRVMVPTFIEVDDLVVVNTEEGTYIERAKN
jgi:elongation factor P